MAHLPRGIHISNLVAVDARDRFLAALSGVSDPEQKRKIIGRVFIEVFEQEAREGRGREMARAGDALPGRHRERVVQGAERGHQEPPQRRWPAREHEARSSSSRCASSSRTRSARPAQSSECRRTSSGATRFPGPGLAIRCLGEVTEARLDALRAADAIVTRRDSPAGLYERFGRRSAVLLPVRTRRRHGRRADVRRGRAQCGRCDRSTG